MNEAVRYQESGPLVRRNPRLVMRCLAGGFALIFGLAVWVVMRQPLAQRRRLPDGTVLTLEKVTYGTQHGYYYQFWWQKLLGPVLPRELRTTGRSVATRLEHQGLVFWFLARDESTPSTTAPGNWTYRALVSELLDERGDRLGPFYGFFRTDPQEVSLVVCHQFPRRGKTVRLRLYPQNSATPAAEFAVPNPDPGPHPTWSPEPLPATRQRGDLEVTLVGLTAPRVGAHSSASGPPDKPPVTHAAFRIRQLGRPAREWEPVAITLSDATGNVLDSLTPKLHEEGRAVCIDTPGTLSTAEAAWKLRVELARSALARFSPAESWTVRGLAVPGRNTVSPGNAAAVRQGVGLTLVGLGGIGRSTWPDAGGRGYHGTNVTARVLATSLRKDQRLMLRAVDERGRAYAGRDPYPRHTQQGWDYLFQLDVPPASKRLDLTFAVQKRRFVEFVAKPSPPWGTPGGSAASRGEP